MRIVVVGTDLPGRTFCEADGGGPLSDVHVGVQVRNAPEGLVAADAAEARWQLDVDTILDREGQLDFRGSAVHGKRGDRFIYLTWGNVGEDGTFHMFRRAKLMLNRVDRTLIDRALAANIPLVATVHLTDKHGGPRCARVDPPALTWTLG